MDKEAYLKQSLLRKVTPRCPLLEYCGRHALTILFFAYEEQTLFPETLIADGVVPRDFERKKIGPIGEAPVWSSGTSRRLGFFKGMCPEVNLFDHEHGLWGMKGTASYNGSWDVEFDEQRLECRHYTECPEYSATAKTIRRKSSRTGLSKRLRFEIFQRDSFICQYCGRTPKKDGVTLHVDHRIPIDAGGTDDISNLVTACADCNRGKSSKVIAPLR